jgi:hypothetical protein
LRGRAIMGNIENPSKKIFIMETIVGKILIGKMVKPYRKNGKMW